MLASTDVAEIARAIFWLVTPLVPMLVASKPKSRQALAQLRVIS